MYHLVDDFDSAVEMTPRLMVCAVTNQNHLECEDGVFQLRNALADGLL